MGLGEERIVDLTDAIKNVVTCSICLDVFWKPVSCESCENAFCGECMASWLRDNPKKCPNRCDQYKQRPHIPGILTKLLSELKVRCQYVNSGCSAILSYESLEKHEQECPKNNNASTKKLSSTVRKPVVPAAAAARQPVPTSATTMSNQDEEGISSHASDLRFFMFRDGDELAWNYSDMNLINSDMKLIADQLKLSRTQQCRILRLLNNKMTASGAQHLAEMLKINQLLQHLDLCDNQIGDCGAEALFDVLKSQNKTLQILKIQNNKITDQIVHKLIEMILSKQTIFVVYMGGNQLAAENKRLILNATRGRPITVKL